MVTTALPEAADTHFIKQVLRPYWDPTQVRGFDVTVDDLGKDAYLPDATTLDNVGSLYPSVVVTPSQPGATGNETTYDFLTTKGAGQNRTISLLATIRAEDADSGYVGDSGTYSSAAAETIVEEIATHIEDICIEHPVGGGSEFSYLGCQRPADVPDDNNPDEGRVVRLAQVEVRAGNVRKPK